MEIDITSPPPGDVAEDADEAVDVTTEQSAPARFEQNEIDQYILSKSIDHLLLAPRTCRRQDPSVVARIE
jgi:hypothetical protein